MKELAIRLLSYGLILAAVVVCCLAVSRTKVTPFLSGDSSRVPLLIPLQRLTALSSSDRHKLLLFFAQSPEWKVTKLDESTPTSPLFLVERRELRDEIYQLPDNVIRSGSTEFNPEQVFMKIFLSPSVALVKPRRFGQILQEVSIAEPSVELSVKSSHFGDDRLRSQISLHGEWAQVEVEERSHDANRKRSQEVLDDLSQLLEQAVHSEQPSRASTPDVEDSCVAKELWPGQYSVRGHIRVAETGVISAAVFGKVSGTRLQEVTTEHELLGGANTPSLGVEAY